MSKDKNLAAKKALKIVIFAEYKRNSRNGGVCGGG